VTALTDKTGVATVGSWKLGPKAGSQALQAFYNVALRFGQAAPGDTAVFNAVAEPGPLASVKAVDGIDQFGLTAERLLMPLRVRALDSFDNPIPGARVAFSVVTGSGSIDGDTVATGSDGEAASGIWTLGPEPGTQELRAEAGNAQVRFRATACGPKDCRVLFARAGNLFTWDAGTIRQVTYDNYSGFARWSPDGKHIALIRDDVRVGAAGIGVYVMNADGSNVVQVTSGYYSGLAWSPDETSLALADNFGIIWILDLNQNAGPPKRVADGLYPDWSPDGKRILFVTAGGAIHAVNADGSDTVEIRPSENLYDVAPERPSWSPDGKRIAFTRCDDITCAIYVMQANGSEMKPLTSDPVSGVASYSPSWSRDGKRIAFTRTGHTTSIYYVNDAGGEPTLLISSATYAEWLR
jgi:Tol biopolymer transport system component